MSNSIETYRAQIQEFGKEYFIMEDMMRTGFLDLTPEQLERLKKGMKEVTRLRRKIGKVNSQLSGLDDVETVLKKIRTLRIERVKKERAEKRMAKAAALKEKRANERQRRQKTPPYLGKGVSHWLKFEGGDAEKLRALRLPVIQNAEELALAMDLTMSQVSWLSYHRKTASIDHYNRFQIPKRKGGFRTIASPKPMLRKAQSWILSHILNKIPLHESAMAFRPNRSIVDNAAVHQGQGVVIRMDLKDFFPSIQFYRVRGLFVSFGYNKGVSTIFALICTDAARVNVGLDGKQYFVALGERYLPQGACTSPALTNIICRKMDKRMTGLCRSLGYKYSRYADDMIFSHADAQHDVKSLITLTKRIIKDENFVLHPDKLAVLRPHQRQAITGIVVNETMNVSRRDLRRFRAFLHQYEQHGAAAMTEKMGKDATAYGKGYLAFINMVNPETAEKLGRKHTWLKAR